MFFWLTRTGFLVVKTVDNKATCNSIIDLRHTLRRSFTQRFNDSVGPVGTASGVECDHGEAVHRYAEVNATRVNIRDLPTVFSKVLTQKSSPEEVTVVCEFGVWSRINLLEVGPETWISTGLITLVPDQPLTIE